MKRTNLVLDEALLEEARKTFGTKTYSETVNKALDEALRISWVRRLPDLINKVHWEGDLSEMRGDRPKRRTRRKRTA